MQNYDMKLKFIIHNYIRFLNIILKNRQNAKYMISWNTHISNIYFHYTLLIIIIYFY